jgi:thiol-disulfide isomerase/thioredoxin
MVGRHTSVCARWYAPRVVGRLSVLGALVAGALTAVLVMAAVVALAPAIDHVPAATPTATPPAASPSPSATSGPSPSASGSPSPGASPSGTPGSVGLVGRPAPALRLPLVGGGTVELAALRGHPVWVNFMGSYCPPCRDEFPLMNGFVARYAQTGLVVLAVDVAEDEATAKGFATQLHATFQVALDRDGSAQTRWVAIVLPAHFWIDAAGIVRDGAYGGIGADIMAAGLGKILPGVTVSP